MKTQEVMREIMKEQGVGLSKLANRIEKPITTTSERLRQKNISVAKLGEIMHALDYKIVVIPREVSVPKGGYEIE